MDPLTRRMAGQLEHVNQQFSRYQEDAPACDVCGSMISKTATATSATDSGSSLGCS